MNFVSPSQIYKQLLDTVMNENNCDELLPFQSSIINYFTAQIEYFNGKFKKSENFEQFTIESHKLEIERIKFLMHRYLERRLKKIEQNASNLINMVRDDQMTAVNLLSTDELAYLQRYVSDIDCYLSDVLLKKMPSNMQRFSLADIQKDELDRYCKFNFVKANRNTSVEVEDPQVASTIVDMNEGGQYMLPFTSIKPNLFSNSNDITLL